MEQSQFSKHLFWDTKRELIDFDRDKDYVIAQVLEYGKLSDWKLIRDYYGLQQIVMTAVKLRSLDEKTLALISELSGIPKEEFRCYTFQQSIPKHSTFM